jgi:hypothetical protein
MWHARMACIFFLSHRTPPPLRRVAAPQYHPACFLQPPPTTLPPLHDSPPSPPLREALPLLSQSPTRATSRAWPHPHVAVCCSNCCTCIFVSHLHLARRCRWLEAYSVHHATHLFLVHERHGGRCGTWCASQQKQMSARCAAWRGVGLGPGRDHRHALTFF